MWNFLNLSPGQLERSPHEAEFFNVGDIDKATSIVREVVQNSIDAKLQNNKQLNVKFTFGAHEKSENDVYYHELIRHVQASELPISSWNNAEEIRYLTIEDFGTTGLDGPLNREEIAAGNGGNLNFYNFWWSEGRSQKTGHRLGRWGLGKTTFHVGSPLRTFWGFTVRNDDKRQLLLGKTLLKAHKLDNAWYEYYGHYSGPMSKPIEEKNEIASFKQKFSLKRGEEPGFSLVIPLPFEEINQSSIVKAIIMHYFFPIIKDMLTVEVTDGVSSIVLNSGTLGEVAKTQNWNGTSWEDRSVDTLMEFLEDTVTIPDAQRIQLAMPVGTPQFSDLLFGNKLEQARKCYASNELVALDVPLKIRPVGKPEQNSYFQIYLKKDESLEKADEFYTREGITISEINNLRNRRVRGLLSALDEPICTFLGDCESPAHTDWKERTEGFGDRYQQAASTLRFIKSSMVNAVRILDQPPPGTYIDLLQDIFFIATPIEENKKEPRAKPPTTPPPGRPQLFEISKIAGGFHIMISGKAASFPIIFVVTAAYDTRRGNPFSRYNPLDFDFRKSVLQINTSNGTIMNKTRNKLSVQADNAEFSLNVKGFDTHRDVIVDIKEAV